MQPASPIDRFVDALRSRSMLFLLAGIATGWLLFSRPTPPDILLVTFHNQSDMLIHSIHLEFGFDLNQSSVRMLQLRPGESHTLALNHQPGLGFNTEISYADGQLQSFCANRGVDGSHQHVFLKP